MSSPTNLGRYGIVKPIAQLTVLLLVGALSCGCDLKRYHTLQGETMGTYYRVVGNCSTTVTQELVEAELQQLTAILSHYDSDSEISAFNRSNAVGEWIPAHRILVDVIRTAQQISEQTNGAFDVTVAPLVELWGFGTKETTILPDSESVSSTLQRVDYNLLEFDESNQVIRKLSNITLDLSGIGKGYGVDHLAEFLTEHDCADFLVDIGGEIRVGGQNRLNQPWRVGIEEPDDSGQVQTVLRLSTGALATSGSYRNFRTFDQTRYSHVIDPRTGYPTSHNLIAVSVYHATATAADAFATAFIVMGFDAALEFAETHEIAIALTTWDSGAENLRTNYSTAMEDMIETRK